MNTEDCRCQTLINLRRIVSSRSHLVLQAASLTLLRRYRNLVPNDKTFFVTRWYRGNSVVA